MYPSSAVFFLFLFLFCFVFDASLLKVRGHARCSFSVGIMQSCGFRPRRFFFTHTHGSYPETTRRGKEEKKHQINKHKRERRDRKAGAPAEERAEVSGQSRKRGGFIS